MVRRRLRNLLIPALATSHPVTTLGGMRERIGGLRDKAGALWLYRAIPPAETTHSHDELEFNLVRRGRISYLVDGRRHDLERGSLLWLFPAHEHLLVQASPDARMWIAVATRAALARLPSRLAAVLRRDAPPGPVHRRLPPDAMQWLDRLAQAVEARRGPPDRPDPAACTTGLLHLFATAWEAFAEAAVPAEAGVGLHPAVAEAMGLFDAGDTRPLATLARVAGLGRAVLSRRFRRDTGMTLSAYRDRCRLARFAELADGKRTLLEAALRAGFGSYAQFHRVFRRAHGCSPREAVPVS